jgi:diguanylate cyclase (GGDEF)-like protein
MLAFCRENFRAMGRLELGAQMDAGTQTWRTMPSRPASSSMLEACLVHIYPTGRDMGKRYPLGELPVVLGRGQDCEVQIDENSVSRRHARIEPTSDAYYAFDLQSTNGTFVNEESIDKCRLCDGDYLRVGNCIYRFLAGGNVESEYHEEIYRLTIKDGLTDLHNKRYLVEFLDRELARSARHARPLALLLFDIDRFKDVNDTLGHLGGDYALRELAALVRKGVRKEELFARYGGEEFAIVLPEATLEKGKSIAERIRESVADQGFTFEGTDFKLTVSIGVASTVGDDSMTPEELIRQADARLYQAKDEGRNRVVG